MMGIDDLCVWFAPSRDQRRAENLRGQGNGGTMMYEAIGCYDCSGVDPCCAKYMTFDDCLGAARSPRTYFWVKDIRESE